MTINSSILRIAAMAGLISLLAPASFARENYSHHTLGSAPNVYRIEIRNLDSFLVMNTGDDREEGELHSVEVELKAGDQRHGFKDVSWELQTRPGAPGGSGYLSINPNDRVELSGGPTDHNLWIHARADRFEFPPTFTFTTKTRELDCSWQRVCGRGGIGKYELTFDIPEFDRPPPRTCQASNTFPISHINGRSVSRSVNTVQKTWSGPYGGADFAVARGGNYPAAILHPLNAEICIASTTRPATYIKNHSEEACLSLPPGNVPGVAQVGVPQCRGNTRRTRDLKAQWRITRRTDRDWSIKNTETNHCLNAKSSNAGPNGGPVMAVGCSNHRDQAWRKIGRTRDQYILQNVSTDRCLTNENGRAMERRCNNLVTQLWDSIEEY